MNIEERTIGEQIKQLAGLRGYSLKGLREEYNKLYNTSYSDSTFSRKLKKDEVIPYGDLQKFGKILGFKVKLELID